LTTLLGTNPLI